MLVFDKDINQALIESLNNANQSVLMLMYSISTPANSSHAAFKLTWQGMIRAAHRVPEFRAIFCGWPANNPQSAATEEAARRLQAAGAACIIAKPGTIIHPKAWSFDDKKLIVGSHNATQAGLMTTRNISYMGQDQSECGQFRDYFEKQWQNIAEPKKRA